MNVRTRVGKLAWLSLVLAAAFALFAFVDIAAKMPAETADWPLKVSLGFVVLFLGLASHASRRQAR